LLAAKQQMYARIEQVVNEPSDTGLQSQLDAFWASWGDVANRPDDLAARTQMLRRASAVTDTLRSGVASLDSLWASGREQLVSQVDEVNAHSATVAELNRRIISAKQSGLPANELEDQRDQVALKLSELTGAQVRKRADGAIDLTVAGSQLVAGTEFRNMAVLGSESLTEQSTDPLTDRVTVAWADGPTPTTAVMTSGTIYGSLNNLSTTLTDVASSLDGVAAALASAVNTQHKLGFDYTGTAGLDMFSGTTAANISVAIATPELVAASGANDQRFSGANADEIAKLAKKAGSPDALYRKFVVDLGIASQAVNRRVDIQTVITDDIDAARQAASGVSLDEEMTNMIAYERAYQAAAKVLNAVDSALDTLINGIGR